MAIKFIDNLTWDRVQEKVKMIQEFTVGISKMFLRLRLSWVYTTGRDCTSRWCFPDPIV